MKIGGERFLREDIKNIKVAVIGDIMLDRYISGNVERISPEAPVPINLVKSQRNVLGGAANTAANLSSLDKFLLQVCEEMIEMEIHFQSY